MSDTFLTLLDKSVRTRVFYKFQEVMGFTNIDKDSMIEPHDIAQRKRAEKKDANLLEFFNIWRMNSTPASERENDVAAIHGIDLPGITSPQAVNLKFMPRDLEYKVWFWSQDKNKLNEVEEIFAFWKFRHPKLDLYVDTYYPLNMDIILGDTSNDKSAEDQYAKGKIYVLSLSFVLEAWILNPEDNNTNSAPPVTSIYINIQDNGNSPVLVDMDGNKLVAEGKQVTFADSGVGTDSVSISS